MMNSSLFTLPLSRRCPCWQMAPAQKNPGAWYRLSPTQCCRETQPREPSSGHLAKAGQVQLLYALRFLRVCPFYPPFCLTPTSTGIHPEHQLWQAPGSGLFPAGDRVLPEAEVSGRVSSFIFAAYRDASLQLRMAPGRLVPQSPN